MIHYAIYKMNSISNYLSPSVLHL